MRRPATPASTRSASTSCTTSRARRSTAGRATLDAALGLEPDHLSLYALTLDDPDAEGLTGPTGDHLPVRPGARRWRDRARAAQDEDRAAAMYELADGRLAAAGFDWYEISNWARARPRRRATTSPTGAAIPGRPSGPGAHAFDGATRRWNAARLDAYLAALLPRDGAPAVLPPGAVADAEPTAGETAMLALRTRSGMPADSVDRPELGPGLRWALGVGLLGLSDDRLILTRRPPAVQRALHPAALTDHGAPGSRRDGAARGRRTRVRAAPRDV